MRFLDQMRKLTEDSRIEIIDKAIREAANRGDCQARVPMRFNDLGWTQRLIEHYTAEGFAFKYDELAGVLCVAWFER